jgi:hypothetical protein
MAAVGEHRWPHMRNRSRLTSSPHARGLTANRRRGIDSRSDRLPCCIDASCTSDICDAASAPPASRTLTSGTRSGNRSDRPGMRCSGCVLAACSSAAGHQSPRKPAATRDHEPARGVYAPPDPVPPASSSSRLPIPLLGPRARKRARTPPRSTGSGRNHRARWGSARRSTAPAPQSEPVTQASRLVALKRAVGGIPVWGENPGRRTSSPTTILGSLAFYVRDANKVWSASPIQRMRPYRARANRLSESEAAQLSQP